jgi:polyisoprenyl-teichoic acid--peptidoglycan teichoic acid transferase
MKRRLLLVVLLLAGCASASPSPSPSVVPTVEPTATPSPTPEPTATPIPIDQAMLARRFTVLVAGADTSESRRAGGLEDWNTDALMVISVSADKSQITILSLPRDTVDIPMADGSIYHRKVNGIAQRLGMPVLRDAMATLLGVPIDRYIRMDMDGFAWMVDAVGGIDVDVKTRIADYGIHLFLQPGPAHFNGAQALAFSRTRADSDYGRAARQQQVMVALARKWLDPGVEALLSSVRLLGSLQTDINLGELSTLLEIGRRSASAEVNGTVLKPPRFSLFVGYEPNSTRGWVMIPNVPEIRAFARAALAN